MPAGKGGVLKGGLSVLDSVERVNRLPGSGVCVNCMRCGKVYDCREFLGRDSKAFLEAGGVCTFCHSQVLLDGAPLSEEEVFGSGQGDAAEAAAARAATLVAADKDTSRTHVHDDQADYFETSSDVWLTNEERAELDRRRLEKERLEEERRRKVVVSVDLVGRRVVMDEQGDGRGGADVELGGGGAAGGSGSAGGSVAAPAPPSSVAVTDALAAELDAVALADAPYGLGPAATAAAIDRVVGSMSLRSAPAPNLPDGRAPLFVKPAKSVGVEREKRDAAQQRLLDTLSAGEGRLQHKDTTLADVARETGPAQDAMPRARASRASIKQAARKPKDKDTSGPQQQEEEPVETAAAKPRAMLVTSNSGDDAREDGPPRRRDHASRSALLRNQ